MNYALGWITRWGGYIFCFSNQFYKISADSSFFREKMSYLQTKELLDSIASPIAEIRTIANSLLKYNHKLYLFMYDINEKVALLPNSYSAAASVAEISKWLLLWIYQISIKPDFK